VAANDEDDEGLEALGDDGLVSPEGAQPGVTSERAPALGARLGQHALEERRELGAPRLSAGRRRQ